VWSVWGHADLKPGRFGREGLRTMARLTDKALRASHGDDPLWAVRWFEKLEPEGVSPGIVYFVQGHGSGPVKIGYTDRPMDVRLAGLQTGSPVRLRVLATHAGDREMERRLHTMFRDWRLHGEWFRAKAFGLRELIDHLEAAS
jgi:hypothetical protein